MTKFRQLRPGTVFGLLGLFLLLAAVCFWFGFGWYLKSEAFRSKVAKSIGHVLKAEGEFMPFHLTGATLYSDGYSARGNDRTFFSDLRADQIRATFNWRALWHRTLKIDEVNVQQLDIQFANRPAHETAAGKRTESLPAQRSAWNVDLRKATVVQSSWRWKTPEGVAGGITGSAFTLTPSDGSWLIDANSGKLAHGDWPQLSIESAKLRYGRSSLFITESVLRTGPGKILVNGEVNFKEAATLQAQIADLAVTPLLAPDWRARLHGNLSGTVRVRAPLTDGALHVEGDLHLVDGQLEALPLLNQIAVFTRTERFRKIVLSKAALSFTRDAGLITAKDIVVESEGLMRVEGACTVVNDQIDGVFQIGVTAASLQWLPGSQARVFTVSHDGYFWTPLRITGPIAHPNEDLSARLVAAAAGELLQNTEDTVRDTVKGLLDLIPR